MCGPRVRKLCPKCCKPEHLVLRHSLLPSHIADLYALAAFAALYCGVSCCGHEVQAFRSCSSRSCALTGSAVGEALDIIIQDALGNFSQAESEEPGLGQQIGRTFSSLQRFMNALTR